MKTLKTLALVVLLLSPLALMSGCQIDPITGKKQFNFYSIQDDVKIGREYMAEFLKVSEQNGWMPDDPESYAMQRKCDEIMKRIAPMTHVPNFPWKIYYTKNPTPNAFCLPGGQIMIFRGLFKKFNPKSGLVINDAELAAVIGHEMAHACARHGTENVSKAMVAQAFMVAVAVGAGTSGGGGEAVEAMNVMIGTLFPAFSRENEREADTYGTTYMAMAGYNPEVAIQIWERGARERPRGASLFDTHPVDAERARYLREMLPRLNTIYAETRRGRNYALKENKAQVFNFTGAGYSDTPAVVMTRKAGIPPAAVQSFRYAPGKVDSKNYWWDMQNRRLVVRVKNNTDKDIEDFILRVVFFDSAGRAMPAKRIKIKNDLDKGKYIDVAVPSPAGSRRAQWNVENIEWD